MTFAALAALLLAVNLAFAIRSTAIALRSSGYVLRKHPSIRSARATDEEPLLSIVVPARNEERQIEQCVQSLLALEYADFEVIAVDDRSTDATLQILNRIAEDDRRLRVVGGEALPPHWVGKPWALVQGAAHARGEWLLFTDADTVHARESAQEAVAYALARRLDVLSLLTDQVMITPAERMFLPSILWTIAFAIGSLAAMNDPRSEAALFNGQYILVRRTAYDAVGGHESVRGEIAEDLELARRFKSDGRFRVELVRAEGLVSTRMYRGFREIWNGFVKNFALGARGRALQGTLGILFFAVISPVTPLVALAALALHRPVPLALCLGAVAVSAGAAEFGMRRLRFPRGSGLWLPVAVPVMVAIFFTSVVAHARGGVTWRGRRY